MRHGPRLAAALVAALTAVAAPALAQQAATPPPPTFSLDLGQTPAQQVTLSVAPGPVPIRIVHGGGPATGVSLDLGVFRNDQGVTLPVTFSLGDAGPQVTHLDNQSISQPVLPVTLHVPDFPSGGTYHGTLLLSAPAGAAGAPQTTVWQFNLSSSADVRPATLVLDQTAAALTASRPWCLLWLPFLCTGGETPTVTVQLRDKTGAFPLQGVVARLDSGLVAPGAGFDPHRHIDATFDGSVAEHLFSTPPAGTRGVPPEHQASVTLAFHDLPAGQYTIPIRFTAANSADDPAQVLTVSLKLRNNALGAILVLILAAALSFVATRVVAMLRQRAAFLQQLDTLRPAWLTEASAILPVVWLRAVVRQTDELSRRHWLSGQDQITAQLTAAQATLAILDRVRSVGEQLGNGIQDTQVLRRAQWALGRVTRQIGAGPLNDAEVARLNAALDAVAAWSTAAQQESCYWADLRPSIVARCAEVQINGLPDSVRPAATALLATLSAALKTEPDFNGKNMAEAAYARLSIIWELRGHPELLARHDWQAMPIDEVYQVVDDFWWSILAAAKPGDLVMQYPAGDSVEAFDAIAFRVRATDDGLDTSFLFGRKLTWHWTISLQGSAANEPLTRALSSEPRIAQYSPRRGRITASVQATYQGRSGPTIATDAPVTVRGSQAFRVWNFFATADLLSSGIALIASVVSGVALYALAPGFGSLSDYLALFTWGAGLDQGKNFLQSLAVYAPAPATAPAPAAAAVKK